MTEIDVSGCRFFIKEYIEDGYTEDDCCVYIKNACGIHITECCLVPECYYKQLKRLEQENAKLKKALKKIKENIEPCSVCGNCSNCNFDFCANKDILKIIDEVLKDEYN